MEPPKIFSLSELVKSTADELRAIHSAEPKPDQVVMRFTECEVELGVTVKADTNGKVKFWVVEGGAGISYENAQKIKLKFSSAGVNITAPVVDEETADLPAPHGDT